MKLSFLEQVYTTLMTVLAILLLGLYLVSMVEGVVRVSLYEDVSGLGLMAVGVLLYFGGELALAETWSVRSRARG